MYAKKRKKRGKAAHGFYRWHIMANKVAKAKSNKSEVAMTITEKEGSLLAAWGRNSEGHRDHACKHMVNIPSKRNLW